MKKSRILISSVFLAGAVAASVAAAGCAHSHTFSEDWSTDDTNHWHAATCKHTDEKSDLGAHEYDATYKCTVCGYQHEHTFTADYVCSDCGYAPANVGIVIIKGTTEYTLDSSLTMNIPMNDFKVKVRKENGMDAGEVQYSLKYYKGKEEISSLNRVSEGAYNVYATATVDGKETESFVVIYVLDEIESIAFKTGTVEQEAGENKMSKTWKYTVTYKSGRQVEVGADDVKVDGLATNNVTDEGKATVSYTYKNLKGKVTTVQTEVPYTVKESSGVKVDTIEFSADNLTATTENTTADTVLVEGVMTAKPGVAVDGNKKSYEDANDSSNNREYSQRLKLNGTGSPTSRSVEIVTTKKAKIVVYAQSGSSTADRQLALAKTTFVSWATTPEEIVGETKTCLGASLTRVEYEVAEAGTYYLLSTSGGINIYGIEIITEAAGSATEAKTVAFSADNLATTTENTTADTVLVEGAMAAKPGVAVDGNKKKYEDANDSSKNREFTQRLKLNGAGNPTSKSVEIITTGKAKIVVYAQSGSGSEDRPLVLAKTTYTSWADTPTEIVGEPQTCLGASLTRVEFEVTEAGTYYLASTKSGINIYGVEIIYS